MSPIKNPDLTNLAPALIITAQYDTIRDEGLEYAKTLKANGNEVYYKNFTDAFHSFIVMDGVLESAKEYNRLTIAALKIAFDKKGMNIFGTN